MDSFQSKYWNSTPTFFVNYFIIFIFLLKFLNIHVHAQGVIKYICLCHWNSAKEKISLFPEMSPELVFIFVRVTLKKKVYCLYIISDKTNDEGNL